MDNCRLQAGEGGKGELCMALFGERLTKVDSDPINKQPGTHHLPCLFLAMDKFFATHIIY